MPSNAATARRYSSEIGVGFALGDADQHHRLLGRAHEHVVVDPVGAELVAEARDADPLRPDEHLEEVVEAGRRLVDDGRDAHDEVLADGLVAEEPEVALVLNAGEVEVGQIAAVVDDSLGVRVREADALEGRELERRLAVGGLAEADRQGVSILEGGRVALFRAAWQPLGLHPGITREGN